MAFPSLDAESAKTTLSRLIALGALSKEREGPVTSDWLKAIGLQCLWMKHRLATEQERANMDEAFALCRRLAGELEAAKWGS